MADLTIVLGTAAILQLEETATKLHQALCHLLRRLPWVQNDTNAVVPALPQLTHQNDLTHDSAAPCVVFQEH